MTLNEIYTAAAQLVYGDITASPPPAHEVTLLQYLILAKHRECQLGYNFWFQKVITTLAITAGTSDYTWPTNYKELISLDLSGYTQTATGITLDSEPTESSTPDFVYWSRIVTPVWSAIYEDDITIYLNWFLIYSAAGDMFKKRGETNEAQFYYGLADEAKRKTEQEDYHRRQANGETF